MAKKKEKPFDPSKPLKDSQKEKFCQLYTSDKEFMGNGVQSVIEAFDLIVKDKKSHSVARNKASRLLTNAHINKRIAYLIECELNDMQVDKQLAFLVAQNDDKSVKLGAIKEYNALMKRVQKQIKHTIEPQSIADIAATMGADG